MNNHIIHVYMYTCTLHVVDAMHLCFGDQHVFHLKVSHPLRPAANVTYYEDVSTLCNAFRYQPPSKPVDHVCTCM